MKSAYELAMERLAKADPSQRPLTQEQKERIAEIEKVYKGRIAEREIFLRERLEAALSADDYDESEKIKKQIADERARLEEEREAEKNQVREGK